MLATRLLPRQSAREWRRVPDSGRGAMVVGNSDTARNVLRAEMGAQARRTMRGPPCSKTGCDRSRARTAWRPRPATTTISAIWGSGTTAPRMWNRWTKRRGRVARMSGWISARTNWNTPFRRSSGSAIHVSTSSIPASATHRRGTRRRTPRPLRRAVSGLHRQPAEDRALP
jgi:hypothetical protein